MIAKQKASTENRILVNNMYYGVYSSSVAGTTGCIKQFCATPLIDTSFPPLVNWECSLCNVQHHFSLHKVVIADTPKKVSNFVQHCATNSIDMDINIF